MIIEVLMQDSILSHNSNQNLKKPIIFAFSGKSNSGKTTLICKLCEYLCAYKIAIIKHDPKDKAVFDTKGKDSYEFFQRANAVALISPTRTTLQIKHNAQKTKKKQESPTQEAQNSQTQAFYDTLAQFAEYDYIFIEGLKTLPFARIVVARETIESSYIPYANAFAIDESVKNVDILPPHLPILPLNDIACIAHFIRNFRHSQ